MAEKVEQSESMVGRRWAELVADFPDVAAAIDERLSRARGGGTIARWLHRHSDEVIDKTILPSGLEQLGAGGQFKIERIGSDMHRKPVVFVVRCTRCQRVRVFRV